MGQDGLATLAIMGAVLLFAYQGALAVALAAASSLSRVALHRLGTENGERLAFAEGLRDTASPYRIAAHAARQLALLAGTLCLVVAFTRAGWSQPLLAAVGLAAVGGVVLLELGVTRVAAVWDPRRALRATAFFVRSARWLLFPLVEPMHLLLIMVGGIQSAREDLREEEQDEEVEALIEVGEREGLLEANEGEMMRSIVDLDETVVREIMTPRPDIVAVEANAEVDEARRVFLQAGHSRLPVFEASIDDVVGTLHVRDLLGAVGAGNQPITPFTREAMFVTETMTVAELLAEMRLKTHLAIVVDEYGGTAGLVTLEDVLEEIVGEIHDEHETVESPVRRERDGSWLVNAAVHVDTLSELFGLEFEDRDFDTVGGFVISELGRVPERGEKFQVRSVEVEVLEVEGQRIRLVRVRSSEVDEQAQAGP